jgi:hypothetical protein
MSDWVYEEPGMKRMTDERLEEIETVEGWDPEAVAEELLEAVKAERKSLNDCAKANTDLRLRIVELEALCKREWGDEDG